MTTDLNIDELERLAKTASKSAWTFERNDFGRDKIFCSYGLVAESVGDGAESEANGEWIAAANPEAILSLIRRVREAEEGARRSEGIADVLAEHKAEAHKRDGDWWRGYEAALHWIGAEVSKLNKTGEVNEI